VRSGKSGYLLFSDIPANVIRKWTPGGKLSVYFESQWLHRSGFLAGWWEYDTGHGKVYLSAQNAITLDHQGRVVFCAHGDRDVVRVEPDGKRTISPTATKESASTVRTIWFTNLTARSISRIHRRPARPRRRSPPGTRFSRRLSAEGRQIAAGRKGFGGPQRPRIFAG